LGIFSDVGLSLQLLTNGQFVVSLGFLMAGIEAEVFSIQGRKAVARAERSQNLLQDRSRMRVVENYL